jgi:hypothetical protein
MEEERARRAMEEAARSRAARERTEREAEEKARAERVARERAVEEIHLETERRERDEVRRADVLRQAAIERARAEGEATTRAAQRALERQHEIALARVREEALARRGAARQRALGVLVGAVAVGASAAAIYLTVALPRERVRAAAVRADNTSREESTRALRVQLGSSDERMTALANELDVIRRDNVRLQADLQNARRELARKGSPVRAGLLGGARGGGTALEYFSKCPPGSQDPMCVQ